VFALSRDKVENQRSSLSLFDELPRRRLEIRFGKFSLPDFFDQNSVGSDTHLQFMNWSVDNNGAWDYAPTRAVTPWDWSRITRTATGASVLRKGSCRKLQTESIWYGGPGRFMRKTGV